MVRPSRKQELWIILVAYLEPGFEHFFYYFKLSFIRYTDIDPSNIKVISQLFERFFHLLLLAVGE